MKQRISKDLVRRRYDELLKSGLPREEVVMIIGQMILNFYGIDSWNMTKGDSI